MTEHIKKLRSCIRHFLQVEVAYVLQIEQLQNQAAEEKLHREASGLFFFSQAFEYGTPCLLELNFGQLIDCRQGNE